MRRSIAPSCARVLLGVALGVVSGACGGEPPPKAPEAAQDETPAPEKKPALKVKSELGSVDPGAVKQAFGALDDKFMGCQKRALDRVEVLSGSVKFFVRIGEDGAARWTYLEGSELGDRETEKCLLDAVRGARWPRPDGGDAEARYGMELPLAVHPARQRLELGQGGRRARQARRRHRRVQGRRERHLPRDDVRRAGRQGARGGRVHVDEGRRGPGRLPDGRPAQDEGLPSPGSWPAKVGFDL